MAVRKERPTIDGQIIAKLAIPVSLRTKIQDLARTKQVSIWGAVAIAVNHAENDDTIDWKAASRNYPTARQGQVNRWKQLEDRVRSFLDGKKGVTVAQVVTGVNKDGNGTDITEKQAGKVLQNWVRMGKVKEVKEDIFRLS